MWSLSHPDGPSDLFDISHFMHDHNLDSSDLILLGDFNLPGIHWPSLMYSASSNPVCKDLITFSLSHNLTQLVHKNTQQNSILESVFISNRFAHFGFRYDILEGILEHNAVLICPISHKSFSYTTVHNFTKSDFLSLGSITDTLADNFNHFVSLSTECLVDDLVHYYESLVK